MEQMQLVTLLNSEKIASISIQLVMVIKVGDVLTIDNSQMCVEGSGFKVVVTAITAQFDTLYLTDVQGEKFTMIEVLIHGANNNNKNLFTIATVNGDSS